MKRGIHIIFDAIEVDFWVYKTLEIIIKEHSDFEVTYSIHGAKDLSLKKYLFSKIKVISSWFYPSAYEKNIKKKSIYTLLDSNARIKGINSKSTIINFSNRNIINESNLCIIEFRYGDDYCIDNKLFGWNELGNGSLLLGSYLVEKRLNETKVIFYTFSSYHNFAIKRSIDSHLFKQVHALSRFLTASKPSYYQNITEYINKPSKQHSSLFVCAKLIKACLIKFAKSERKVTRKWSLAISNKYFDRDVSNFKIISPPNDYFWADPFVLNDDNGTNIFIEEKKIKTHNGYISLLILEEDKAYTKKIIEEKYHLSYPHVFKFNSEYYMFTESLENKTINLYKSSSYPTDWKFEKYIFSDIQAVDPTLIKHNGVWWLFVNQRKNSYESIQDELYIYYSDDPTSTNWSSHKLNPVVSDVRTSRPAGKIINHNGKLIRPSQNSQKRYGYSLNFMEIIKLNTYEYEEQLIEKLEPWNSEIQALHTFSTAKGKTLIDIII